MPKYYHTPYGWREVVVDTPTKPEIIPATNWLCGNAEESCYVSALTRQEAEKLVNGSGMKVIGLSKILN